MDTEKIVFVHKDGTLTGGVGPKLASHTEDTKLHLAFSCYIFRESDGAFLYTQRAHHKKVWPGVWTNSVCGHVAPGEAIEAALHRRVAYEVGITELRDLSLLVPDYIYKTPPFNGIIEHEFCPIYMALTEQEPVPRSEEVAAYQWITFNEYTEALRAKDNLTSWWAKDQLPLIKNKINQRLAEL